MFEKVCSRCSQYPPDDVVTFSDIKVEWGGQQENPKWETAYVDNVCNNRAKIVSPSEVQITWNSKSNEKPDLTHWERNKYPDSKKWHQ